MISSWPAGLSAMRARCILTTLATFAAPLASSTSEESLFLSSSLYHPGIHHARGHHQHSFVVSIITCRRYRKVLIMDYCHTGARNHGTRRPLIQYLQLGEAARAVMAYVSSDIQSDSASLKVEGNYLSKLPHHPHRRR